DGNGRELAVSPIVFNARDEETIDLTIRDGAAVNVSEYERYEKELAPLIENVPVADLTEEDIRFLSAETGISDRHLRFLRTDAQWSARDRVARGVFYGLLRHGLPTD